MTDQPLAPVPGGHDRSGGSSTPDRRRQRVAVYGICQEGRGPEARVLLVRAAPFLTVAGRWFLPGGGLEHGEDPPTALRRECEEETGLQVVVGDLRGVLSDLIDLPDGSSLHTVRIVYAVGSFAGDLRDESQGSSDQARWFGIDRAFDLPLMPYVRRALTELR
jgi:8-oxo-dGTP diphosphatase